MSFLMPWIIPYSKTAVSCSEQGTKGIFNFFSISVKGTDSIITHVIPDAQEHLSASNRDLVLTSPQGGCQIAVAWA